MAQHFLQPTEDIPKTPATILIIENDRNNRILMENVLHLGGYNFISASDGQEALAALNRGARVDLVLTDLSMPGLDGYKVAQLIRSRPGYEQMPIVAVTAYAMSGDREYALAHGCTDYLTKPFPTGKLLEVVARLLQQASR
jgi:CheY-like chemotaxis protein